MTILPKGTPIATRAGLAIAPTIPLMMQGPAPIETFQQQKLAYADNDTIARLIGLYDARDPVLAHAFAKGSTSIK